MMDEQLKFTGERLVPGQVNAELELEHLNRYFFARQFASGLRVLDAACGVGYGTAVLAECASSVVGIDIDKEAVEYAEAKFASENIKFLTASVENLPFEDNSFDLVVSFETLEHVDENTQQAFLSEIKRVLTDDGRLVISTPNKDVYNSAGQNHFHVKELNLAEFEHLLNKNFKNIKLFGQQFDVCNMILEDKGSIAKIAGETSARDAEYFVVVCCDREIVSTMDQVMPQNGKLAQLMQWAISTHELNEQNNVDIRRLLDNEEKLRAEHEKELADFVVHHEEEFAKYIIAQNKIIAQKDTIIANLSGHIDLLLESDRELANIKSSRSWRIMRAMQQLSGKTMPLGSKRRLFAKIAYRFIRHPVRFLKKATPKRIGAFFKLLKSEGVSGVSHRFDRSMIGTQIPRTALEFGQRSKAREKISDYAPIAFKQPDVPVVSIIIPVYNQFEYTYTCIESILKFSGDIPYEIIIANDCSTDFTAQIEEVILGIRVVTPPENLRFLKNCNNAAKHARGKYIFFLNNDTQVQNNWLLPLVELMEQDEKVGITGSKLVYADGSLQEAGGILWQDASGWNYGNGSDCELPEYNYVKEVDYISGAAIMIRKALWEEIGGFDELFAPAYYEDADLAFEVRNRGYKVLYQPESVVVHFEGVSNGTDVSSGQKAYQAVNQEKFLEKWREKLQKEHFNNGENVFLARDRSVNKKTLLMVDHYVPHYDKDAGSRAVFQYLKLFLELGYNVKFIGDNFYKHEPYTTALQQMGIEVLYGPHHSKNWKEWIKENSRYIDFAFLNRPHISVKYIDQIKKHPHIKVFYCGHDLHYLRELRKYEVTGDKETKKSSDKWKQNELDIMRSVNMSYYFSPVEIAEIKKLDPDIACRAIPLNILEPRKFVPFDTNRKDLLFVGGFGHDPNVDAVNWLSHEIFPIVNKALPDVKVYIVGSNPPETIKNLANERFIITGFVSDDELNKLYASCRLVIVPLRYGAGIKGKVVEAMYNQAPLLTTSIGAEGLDGILDSVFIEDAADDFAKCISDVYNNDSLLAEKAGKGLHYVLNNFSRQAVIGAIQEDFGI